MSPGKSAVLAAPPPEDLTKRDSEFTGREWALERISHFTKEGPENLLLVVGKPGAGKTALAVRLARMARAELTPPPGVPVPVLHATRFCQWQVDESIQPVAVLEQLATQLRVTVPGYEKELLKAAGANRINIQITQNVRHAESAVIGMANPQVTISTDRHPRWVFEALLRQPLGALHEKGRMPGQAVVLVDGLDESAETPFGDSGDSLVDLLAMELTNPLPGVRWVLSTRAEGVVGRLPSTAKRFDLASDLPKTTGDLTMYAERRLASRFGARARHLAQRIARAADGNFLYAYYVVRDVLALDAPPHELANIPLPAGLAGIYEQFLGRQVTHNRNRWRNQVRPVLGALVQARGPVGLNGGQLVKVTGLRRRDVDDALEVCGPYLAGDPDHGLRIYHQSLRDYLRADDGPHSIYSADASRDILEGLAPPGPVGERDWARADPHLLEYGIQYAVDCHRATELITDPEFLVYANPTTLLSALGGDLESAAQLPAAVYRASADQYRADNSPDRRRQLLAIDAVRFHDADLARQLARGLRRRPRWATGQLANSALRATLTNHANGIRAVDCVVTEDGPVALAGSGDGRVHVWDLVDYRARDTLSGPARGVLSVVAGAAAGAGADGRPVVIAGSSDGTIWSWSLGDGNSDGELTGQVVARRAVVGYASVAGKPVVVSGSQAGAVQLWEPGAPAPRNMPTAHAGQVNGVACTEVSGEPVVVTVSADSTARAWNIADDTERGLLECGGPVFAVACTTVAGRPVAVLGTDASAGRSALHVWDLTDGTVRDVPTENTRRVYTVACTDVNGRPVACTGAGQAGDDTVRVWDLTPAQAPALLATLPGHTKTVNAVACVSVAGRALAVSGSADGDLRVWDLADAILGSSGAGHASEVTAVASCLTTGGPVMVSGAADGSLRSWDLVTGAARDELPSHTGSVCALTCARLPDGPVFASAGGNDAVRVWNLASGTELASLPTYLVSAVAGTRAADRTLLVCATEYGTAAAWDLASRTKLADLAARRGTIRAIAAAAVDGRLVMLCGMQDGSVRIWAEGEGERPPLRGHQGAVNAVDCTRVHQRLVAVSGSDDKTVRMWPVDGGEEPVVLAGGHDGPVRALACAQDGDRPLAASGSDDRTVKVWDLAERRIIDDLAVPYPVRSLAWGPGHELIIGCGYELVVMEPAEVTRK